MAGEPSNTKSTAGPPMPTGILKPRLMEVERSVNVDDVFRQARRSSSGEHSDETGGQPENLVEGQRAVAIVTPERLIILDPCAEPNTIPAEVLAQMCELLPPDPPLTISVISYTNVEALKTDMTQAIPFRGFLLAWAYAGHNIVVFEGNPSAFESGVRDCDVLLVDSGMLPFVQFNWVAVALRVMRPGGRIFIHDRETYTLSLLITPAGRAPSPSQAEADYVELLLRGLMRSSHSTMEITSGKVLPDLADLVTIDVDDWVAKLRAERDKLNTDVAIDLLLHKAGWRWYRPLKTTGTLKTPTLTDDGTVRNWTFSVKLMKTSQGKRQLQIER